jgi:hypothetical protein
MLVEERFVLDHITRDILSSMIPKFGYNGFGELVFRRTYSRNINDYQENFADVVARVTEGTLSIRKDHYLKNGIHWNERYWQAFARKFSISMFNMTWLPPGRGLWAMGTDHVYKHGSMALNNCGATFLGKNLSKDFAWMMDVLMLGVGVGFEPLRTGLKVYRPTGKVKFVVPDSREGWVESVEKLIEAFTIPDRPLPDFDYSKIRPEGEKIKGFGGKSSGPAPLKDLHEAIIREFSTSKDEVLLKTNIANLIGKCVVSGNVRRCLAKGTMVSTSEGPLEIEKIKVGMKVETPVGYRKVTNVFVQGVQEVVRIITENHLFVECTDIHRVATYSDGYIVWKPTCTLRKENILLTNSEGEKSSVTNCSHKILIDIVEAGEAETFDLEVEDVHCFFANGILVHNSAELAKGKIDDEVFINLKNYEKYPERINFGWMSNNSVALETEEDFLQIGKIVDLIIKNGEPGVINVANMKYGRIGKSMKGLRYDKGTLFNPCGEQVLEDKEVCTLVETFPTVCRDVEEWYEALEYATFYASTVTLLMTQHESTNKVMSRNRRIGVGISDFTGWRHRDNLFKVIRYMRKGYKKVRDFNRRFNHEADVPEAIRVTTVKPGGSVPKLPGKTSGAGYPTFHYTLRRIKISKNHALVPLLIEANIPYEESKYDKYTYCFEYPILQGPAKPAHMATIWEQAFNVITLQREWSDNSVSNTLYFKPKWVLKSLGNLTKYISEEQAKLIEQSKPAEIQIGNYKIVDGYKVYEYDPSHEEDDLEAVLTATVPHVKSISLLPHTPIGAYPQMPEEGITEEEYLERVSKIKPINWDTLVSEGEDELYCQGDVCQPLQ